MGRALFGKYKRKSSKTDDNAPKETSSNTREPCSELPHDDREEITPGKFPFPELFPLFAGKIDHDTMNIFTGRIMSNSHHMKGEGAKSKKDFLRFKACFCLEWIRVDINGVLYWVRCGNMFNLYSPGCFTHTRAQYKEGPNSLYYRLARNLPGNWGMIKNTYLEEEKDEPTEEQKIAEAQASADAVAEQIAVASQKGESIQELQNAYNKFMQVVATSHMEMAKEPHNSSAAHQNEQSKTAQPVSARGFHTNIVAPPIYGNRRKPGGSAPGNLVLDKKRAAMNDSNNRYKSNAHYGALAGISEEGQSTERRKPKKNQGVNGSDHGFDRV